ncbi:MAG: SCO family protein [Gammaproteobacteria bacterium]|nr:SCO family protein [Gammaproteobacteria bacterium]
MKLKNMNILILRLSKYTLIFSFICFSPLSYCETGTHIDHSHHMEMMMKKNKKFSLEEETYNLSNIELITSTGSKTTLLKELDTTDPVILNFIFTTCTAICPIMSGTFSEVNKKLSKNRVKMISISIDPEHDTPKALRAYAKRFNANDKWHFYTGEINNIINIQKSFSDYRGNKMNHAPSTYIRISKDSKWLKVNGFISSDELVKIYNKNITM